MKSKGFLFLASVVVILGGYLAWDFHHEEGETKAKDEKAKIFTLKVEQVNEFEIKNSHYDILISRSVDGWKITKPLQDWADNTYVDDFLDHALNDKIFEVAKENPPDWSVYGLDNPVGTITFRSQSGAVEALDVSPKQNFEQNTIARRQGDKRVLIVPAGWAINAGRIPLDFRDKRMFRHKIGSVDKLSVQNKHGKSEIVLEAGHWIFPGNRQMPVDQNRAHEVLTMLSETQANEFMSEAPPTPAQKKEWGLDHPAAIIDIVLTDKKWNAQLGHANDKAKSEVAAISDPAFTLRLEPGAGAKFEEITDESFRDHKLPFQFEKSVVQKIVIETPLKKSTFLKKDSVWTMNNEPNLVVESDKVKDLIEHIAETSARKYVGLANFKTKYHVSFFEADGKPIYDIQWGDPFALGEGPLAAHVALAKSSLSKETFQLDEQTISRWELPRLTKPKAQGEGK